MKKFLDESTVKSYVNVASNLERAREEVKEFFSDENGLSGVVVAVILILVAVLLLMTFKDNITKLLDNLWDQIFESEKTTG